MIKQADKKAQPKRTERYVPNLRGHIAQCEWNYHNLMKLVPALQTEDRRSFLVEKADTCLRIDMLVQERCKYTTTLSVSQNLISENITSWLNGPSMTVRLYHDAGMAEVISFEKHRHIQPRYEYPNPNMHHRDEKAQLNRFLGDWLKHCLHYGKIESPVSL